jgi:hypothetical protein
MGAQLLALADKSVRVPRDFHFVMLYSTLTVTISWKPVCGLLGICVNCVVRFVFLLGYKLYSHW